MMIGWFVFQEVPANNVLRGSAIVAASGIGVLRLASREN
jgi:hypothetical protein